MKALDFCSGLVGSNQLTPRGGGQASDLPQVHVLKHGFEWLYVQDALDADYEFEVFGSGVNWKFCNKGYRWPGVGCS